MNLDYRGSMRLAEDLLREVNPALVEEKDIVICPSHSVFLLTAEILRESGVAIGAQDIFWEEKGAFTGCESPQFLAEAGCQFVIVGHSERRQYLGETDEIVNKKIQGCLDNKIAPILCVGETADDRRNNSTDNVLFRQVTNALKNIDLIPDEQIVIAYEPVWVIGSGRTIEPEEAEHAFKIINQALIDLAPLTIIRSSVRIVYGGSIDSSNFKDFTDLEHFSGFLVGGASLKAEEFINIAKQI